MERGALVRCACRMEWEKRDAGQMLGRCDGRGEPDEMMGGCWGL